MAWSMTRNSAVVSLAGVLVVLLAAPAQARLDYEVRPGDTLSAIAAQHGVSPQSVASANDLDDPDHIVSGTVLVIPDGSGGTSASTHVVAPGETLGGIAAQYGVSTSALAEANGITNPDLIVAGQPLRVSGATSSASTTVSAPAATTASTSSTGVAASRDEVRRLITDAAVSHGWRPAVPLGLAMQESGWNNTVVSSVGARGIMQVMPATGEWVSRYLLRRPIDLGLPADNVAAGMAYLDYLYNRFDGNVEHALAAYYEGPQRVTDNGGPSSGAQRYVDNVLALADRYR